MIGNLFIKETSDTNAMGALKPYISHLTGLINVAGFSDSSSAHAIAFLAETASRPFLVLTSSENRAKKLKNDIQFFTDRPVFHVPSQETVFFRYDAKSHTVLEKRLNALIHIVGSDNCIVVSSIDGALKKMVPRQVFEENKVQISIGDDIQLDQFMNSMVLLGYERTHQVEAKGQYSIRGGIIDIYPLDAQDPYRIELFDTEIDSMRTFDIASQRSIENVRILSVYPAQQLIADEAHFNKAKNRIKTIYDKQIANLSSDSKKRLQDKRDQIIELIETRTNLQMLENYIHYFYSKTDTLLNYMNNDTVIAIEDFDRITDKIQNLNKEISEDFKYLLEKGEVAPSDYHIIPNKDDYNQMLEDRLAYLFTPFVKGNPSQNFTGIASISSKPVPAFQGRMELFESEIRQHVDSGYKIFITCSTLERTKNVFDFIERMGVNCSLYSPSIDTISPGKVIVGEGNISTGFEYIKDKILMISDTDIFANAKIKKAKTKKEGKAIKAFTDLKVGDYIVHENHGIAKYLGIEQLSIQDVKKDYLKLKYAGEDMLYVPVEQMDLVQKYIGADGGTPKINKLSSSEWRKTKAKVKGAIVDMAKDLLELNALRMQAEGFAFAADTTWQKEFEDAFPYEETPDQLKCIAEIKKDMEQSMPMDRLLCGDVGYGKTEVAARAVFKCVVDGKQAAVLVPTTILANQHYNTFLERFEKFPFNIDMLSRFKTDKEQKQIIKKVKEGNLDVVIGTHRLLSKDIVFKDLGLLIVDEEQKFGVQHKEAIKIIKKNVDVLTLSATPIPRTLHMSLIGLRDMSTIEDPPEERFPVQTFVVEYEDEIIKEAILREIERGGQVFFVFNRVRGIRKISAHLQELLPGVSIAVAHGQMNEKELENIMISFMKKKYDVLVCTTIIESGIDIQNTNTIIVYDADKFGLSQLYQLRGRVGRSNRMAYAYFAYQKDKVLTEQSEKRLKAIKEFTEFGSGFKIAMRDLEIRGAGNLLGVEQHGHLMMIGYELYCKLLDETVKELKGEAFVKHGEVTIEIEVNAYIPQTYISNEMVKVEVYKKIAVIQGKEEIGEIEDELIDRFGDVPMEVYNLIQIAYIKSLSEKIGISKIREEKGRIIFEFYENNVLKPYIINGLAAEYGTRMQINAGQKPFIKYHYKKYLNRLKELIEFLEAAEHLLIKMQENRKAETIKPQ